MLKGRQTKTCAHLAQADGERERERERELERERKRETSPRLEA